MILASALLGCGGPVGLRKRADPDDTLPEVLSTTPCGACGGDCAVEALSYAAAYHVTGGVEYGDVPPAGGPHDPCWATFGVHDEPVADEHWVHNLEHGAVVVLHDCDGCDAEVAEIEAWAADRAWALVTPYTPVGAPFAALAWGWRLRLGCWDEPEVSGFYDDHVDQAPESVLADPAASCM